jgi:hypothetical protein
MIVRPRRAIPRDGLVILISTVRGLILNWIRRLSIQINKLSSARP